MKRPETSPFDLTGYQQAKQEQDYEQALDILIETISRMHPFSKVKASILPLPLEDILTELEQFWAEGYLTSLEPKYYLCQAEISRLAGRYWSAVKLYDQAIEAAKEGDQCYEQAIAHELTAQFWLAEEKRSFAVLHINEACTLYLQIGFTQRVDALKIKFSEFDLGHNRRSTIPTAFSESIPSPNTHHLESLLKAWRTISSETVLSNLLKKIIVLVLEQSGADKGCLVFDKHSTWVIEAQVGNTDDTEPEVLQAIPVVNKKGEACLPVSVLDYVATNQDIFVVDDTGQMLSPFNQDPYFDSHPIKSVVCMPFVDDVKRTGMLYLENGSRSGVFTPRRVETLRLLSIHAALSLETAILHSNLESALEVQAELNTAYSRFVPREIVEFLGKDTIAQVQLGDQTQQDMTVMFSDIRSFTAISEQMTPQENFNFINAYFSRVSPIIREHQGFIDKYIGDAVMALFPGDSDNAIMAAIAMQKAVGRYNVERQKQGDQSIKIGVGLHMGTVMLGTIGEAKRMDGTVISDAVNLAFRLEGLTKLYGAPIVVSEQTLFNLDNPSRYNFRFLDKVKVKGKQIQVSVFEVFDGSSDEIVELKLKTRTDFEKGLFHYHSQEFREAIECFNNVLELNPKDRAAQVYLRQATHCLWIGWESVKVLTEK
ncbi:MAG: GAF domain-containing protein [Anaerolineae bacterium]|nr:GAF domain-containing protein [Anaerolineae bacterium]